MKHVFRMLLRLYPKRFRDAFYEEMLETFDDIRREEGQRDPMRRILFDLREVLELLTSICREQAPFGRFSLRTDATQVLAPVSDIAQEEQWVRFHLAQTINCIANHRFAGARFHGAEEDRARERLRTLRDFSRG